jgi:hypothetical protein
MFHNAFHYGVRVAARCLHCDALSVRGWAPQATAAYVSELADPSLLGKVHCDDAEGAMVGPYPSDMRKRRSGTLTDLNCFRVRSPRNAVREVG